MHDTNHKICIGIKRNKKIGRKSFRCKFLLVNKIWGFFCVGDLINDKQHFSWKSERKLLSPSVLQLVCDSKALTPALQRVYYNWIWEPIEICFWGQQNIVLLGIRSRIEGSAESLAAQREVPAKLYALNALNASNALMPRCLWATLRNSIFLASRVHQQPTQRRQSPIDV